MDVIPRICADLRERFDRATEREAHRALARRCPVCGGAARWALRYTQGDREWLAVRCDRWHAWTGRRVYLDVVTIRKANDE